MTKPIVTAVGRLLNPKGNEPRIHKVIVQGVVIKPQ